MDIVYPPLVHEEALVVEVGEDMVNTSIMARLEVEAHPLPYFSDIVWTITSELGEKQVSGTLGHRPLNDSLRLITTVRLKIIASA